APAPVLGQLQEPSAMAHPSGLGVDVVGGRLPGALLPPLGVRRSLGVRLADLRQAGPRSDASRAAGGLPALAGHSRRLRDDGRVRRGRAARGVSAGTGAPRPTRRSRVRPGRLAWMLWIAFAVVVTAVVLREHERRSVTPAYRDATEAWWAHRAMYDRDVHGFLYLPPAAVLYTPFTWPPGVWGGVIWRGAARGVRAGAAGRLAGLGGGSRRPRFLVITLLTLPGLAGSARNGQMNVPMAGLMAHAAVDLAAARWWRAGLGLAL